MLIFSIIFYLLLTLGIGRYANRYVKTASDYAIAGRRLPTYMVASGLFATWFGSETILGATAEFEKHGLLGIIEDPFGASLCLILLGMFFARPLYKLQILTFSDYFGLRYSRMVEMVSAFFMIPSYFGWVAAQLVAMAILLQALIGLPVMWGILSCAAIVLLYSYWGGMWSVSITDTLQTAMIIIGLTVILLSLWQQVPDKQVFINSLPANYFQFYPTENSLKNWLIYFSAWITIGWGSIPQQDVFQRVLAAKNVETAIRGSYLSGVLYLSVALLPIGIIVLGNYLYPSTETTQEASLPEIILQHTSTPIQVFFFGALLSAILSTCSGAVLAPATVVAENMIKPYFGDKLTDSQLLRLMRISVVIVMACSVALALVKNNIYELVQESSALSLVALFVPLVAGLYWKKATARGAVWSMVAGTGVWTYLEYIKQMPLAMLTGFGASVAAMLVGSLIASKPDN